MWECQRTESETVVRNRGRALGPYGSMPRSSEPSLPVFMGLQVAPPVPLTVGYGIPCFGVACASPSQNLPVPFTFHLQLI